MEVSKQNRDNIVQTMHAVNNLKHKITYNIFKLGRLYSAAPRDPVRLIP
jgi:hypothetical protein